MLQLSAKSKRFSFLISFLILILGQICFALPPDQIYEQVKDSIVVIKTYNRVGELISLGSGVMLPSGKFVTNYHVIKKGNQYRIGQGNNFIPAVVVAVDKEKDICILSASGLSSKPANLGKSGNLKVGERVYAIGAPRGLELSLSEGLVSQLRGGPPPIIQTTAAISPGSSGGGLFNAEGELVGITTLQMKEGQNLNFALPVEWITQVIAQETKILPPTKIPEPQTIISETIPEGKSHKTVKAFYVVVGSFSDKKIAIDKSLDIRSKGYHTEIFESKSLGMFRVALGSYSYNKANLIKDEVVKNGYAPKDTWIISKEKVSQ